MGYRVLAVPQPALEWLESRAGVVLTRNARGIAAVDGRGNIRGMVAYDNWTENSVQCHMATETPLAWRGLVPAVFEYPFVQAGRGVLLGFIRGGNARSLDTALRLGFREAGRLRDGAAKGEDVVVVEMRREECRWLKEAS